MVDPKSLPPAVQEILKAPSSKPPSGVVPNLDNPANRNHEALALGIVCIILATTSTSLRLYSRAFIVKHLRFEDYLGLIAFLPYIGIAWCFLDWSRKVGFFVHQWDLRGQVIIDVAINSFVARIVYSLLMLVLKTAVLLDWQRIFVLKDTHRTLFWISSFVIALNIATHIIGLVTSIAACRPLEILWHFWVKGSCINRKARDVTNAALILMTDVFIFVLPQKIIWNLQLTGRRKLGISIVFSIGLLAIAAAAGRLYSTAVLDYPDRRNLSKPFDTTYRFSQTLIWIQCETTCIFLVFCVPELPKIFAEQGIVSQIAMSLRSWTRLGAGSPSKESRNHVWPPTIGSSGITPQERARRAAEAEGKTQDNTIELSVIRDGNLRQASDRSESASDPGIVRTIELACHDDAASKTSTTPIVDHQHPWMGR